MRRPPRDPSAVRDRALRSARRTTRACVAGALGLSAGLSLFVAHASRSQASRDARGTAATTAAAVRTRVPPPQPVPQIAGAPPAPQPPVQAPAPDVAAAPAPAPAPPAAVSGGS